MYTFISYYNFATIEKMDPGFTIFFMFIEYAMNRLQGIRVTISLVDDAAKFFWAKTSTTSEQHQQLRTRYLNYRRAIWDNLKRPAPVDFFWYTVYNGFNGEERSVWQKLAETRRTAEEFPSNFYLCFPSLV